jgi:hypothetical protein
MFRWRAHHVEPGRRTPGGGQANGVDGLHDWRFRDGGSASVETDESWSGAIVHGRRDDMQKALDVSQKRVLDVMKRAST